MGTALFLLLAACGCDSCGRGGGPQGRSLDAIKRSGKLIVVTRNAPTTYYIDRDGAIAGFEHDMAVAFGAYLGVEPEFHIINTISGILDAVASGQCDIAAAGLTRTDARAEHFRVGPVYQTVKQLVVARRDGKRPKTIDDLSSVDLRIVAGSSYEERLTALQEEHPQLTWETEDDVDTEQLLEKVWRGEIDCTVSDDNIFRLNRRYYPELVATMAVSQPQPLAWFLSPGSKSLGKQIGEWFDDFSASGEQTLLEEKYFGYVEIFDYVDTRKFVRRIHETLPKYRPIFEEAAGKYDHHWTLLAAQAYQESHWRPRASSPTGVKGIMMLTLAASEDVGVTDRLDPEQSIYGGARYLRRLIDRLPEEIEEPDRTWIALAAYNVGMGHLYDARDLARRLGKDPDVWVGMQEVLPLLSHAKYYKTLEHGYARGSEPVMYVNRIRNYEDILRRTIE
jgi:membrane-bound lytic murein transglycosylase F